MTEIVQSFFSSGWIQYISLFVALLALVLSILAYRRVSLLFNSTKSISPDISKKEINEPVVARYKSSDVSLLLTAKRNAKSQLRLILKNTGIVTARDIEFLIGEPIRVINEEEVVNGISDSIELKESAIKPRLTVIDAKTNFPISEVRPGVVVDIFAVTTMGYGKICDFPISINWLDDRGVSHFQDEVLTI